jgi:heme O synthase-like polyprenyltransferase
MEALVYILFVLMGILCINQQVYFSSNPILVLIVQEEEFWEMGHFFKLAHFYFFECYV